MIAALESRNISPSELLQAHLDQAARLHRNINPFTLVLGERATPDKAEPPAGPLHGVPFTVKDSFDVKGHPTLCGSRFRSTHRAAHNSTVVRRMKQAGGVLLGKTNCPELLANWETDNHVTGRTNNPWNRGLTPGGSSGGESAAIAAFCSPAGIGSDGGGSIRWPAHCTGICGLKPTPGRVSGAGHFPVMANPVGLLGVAGPMARSVDDLSILFPILAGYDVDDPFSVPFTPPQPIAAKHSVGILDDFPMQPACRGAVVRAAGLLVQAGYPIEPFPEFPIDRAHDCWFFLFARLAAPFTRELMAKREHQAHWTGLELYQMVRDHPDPTGKEVVEQLAIRDRMRSAFLRELQRFPVVLAPVSSATAFPHRTRAFNTDRGEVTYLDAMKPLTFVNLFGLPSLTLPMVVVDGIPAGVQLIAAPYQEELLLSLGKQLEEARGPLPSPL